DTIEGEDGVLRHSIVSRGHFGYVDYEEQLRRLGDREEDIAALWYKDLTIEDYFIGLRMFLNDRDALAIVTIAEQRGHVELFVVHEDSPEEGFPEIEYVDVGDDPVGEDDDAGVEGGQNEEGVGENHAPDGVNGDGATAEASVVNENLGTNVEEAGHNATEVGPNVEEAAAMEVVGPKIEEATDAGLNDEGEDVSEPNVVENEEAWAGVASAEADANGDDDSDDAEYVPSSEEVDSVDDIQFTDSEEDLDLDDNFFEVQTDAGKKGVDNEGKGVVNEEFHDAGEDSDELQEGYAVGGYDREEGDKGDTVVFPVHKQHANMACYNWEPGTVYATKDEFKETVIGHVVYTKRGIKSQKIDRKRVIVNCQAGCPFRLYCVKMGK
ncbi:hypothetical protein PIB30_047310, partial [Stylosanthes scabra]|nr:hypothetical protein [Stylosanthes scabra]